MPASTIHVAISDDSLLKLNALIESTGKSRNALIEDGINALERLRLGKANEIDRLFDGLVEIQKRNNYKESWVWFRLAEYYPNLAYVDLELYAKRLGLSLSWAKESLKPIPVNDDDIAF